MPLNEITGRMKAFMTLLVLCTLSVKGQDSLQLPLSATAIGTTLQHTGSILRSEEKEIFEFTDRVGLLVKRVRVCNINVFDAGSGNRDSGLSFTSSYYDRNNDLRVYQSYMDAEELGLLTRYIDMLAALQQKEEENSARYIVNTKDLNFTAEFIRYSRTRTKWNYSFQLRKNYYRTELFVELKELIAFGKELQKYR